MIKPTSLWGYGGYQGISIRGCGKYVCGEYMSRSKHELDPRIGGYQSFYIKLNIHDTDPHEWNG